MVPRWQLGWVEKMLGVVLETVQAAYQHTAGCALLGLHGQLPFSLRASVSLSVQWVVRDV